MHKSLQLQIYNKHTPPQLQIYNSIKEKLPVLKGPHLWQQGGELPQGKDCGHHVTFPRGVHHDWDLIEKKTGEGDMQKIIRKFTRTLA